MGGIGFYSGCFVHLDSANLSIRDTKRSYLKKDLEKLEDRGVKIIVTTPAKITVTTGGGEQYCSLPAPEGK